MGEWERPWRVEQARERAAADQWWPRPAGGGMGRRNRREVFLVMPVPKSEHFWGFVRVLGLSEAITSCFLCVILERFGLYILRLTTPRLGFRDKFRG